MTTMMIQQSPFCRPHRPQLAFPIHRSSPSIFNQSTKRKFKHARSASSPSSPDGGNDDNNDDNKPPNDPEQADDTLQLPRQLISQLRDTVFGLDTLFVTSVENYGSSGVLFKGNLRGDPSIAQQKLSQRLQQLLGNDSYRLFLLQDQEENPVAVVIPSSSAEFQVVNPLAESLLAALLGATTIATTLNINGAELFNAALLTAKFDPDLIQQAFVPGTLATMAILGAHEVGHRVAARSVNLTLAPPIFIPAGLGLLGSFGAITRISSPVVPNRRALATVAAPGPLAGAATSLVFLLIGLGLMVATGQGGVEVDSASFKESLVIGTVAQFVFGDRVFEAEALSCHPLFVVGWAGLIINAINSIPAGELDGGRVFLGLFGRPAASRMSAISFFLLGIAGITSSLSLFWLLLVLTLQRGPIIPCSEELSGLEESRNVKVASLVVLLLPLLVLLPHPMLFLSGGGGGDDLSLMGGIPPTF